MSVNTPFFISPAYCDPRMTISRVLRLRLMDVLLDRGFAFRQLGKDPAL